ncbi:MAG: methyltransferase domain-containing protein, partial [Phycisphaerales bacterium]
ATYFLLHTTDYWNDPRFAAKCAQLEAYGHEVGLHLNLLTEWIQGRCAALDRRLTGLLEHLRAGGVDVVGTSGHGDRACYEHGFINYWIWKELRGDQPETTERGLSAEGIAVADPQWQVEYPKNHRLRRGDGAELDLWTVSLADHDLAYDAVHVQDAQYWTDTGGGWRRSADPLKADLSRGRHQILMHPHWWRGRTRTYFVLCPARSGSKWLVNVVDQATSCRGLHEWTLNHRRTGDEYELDKRTGDDFLGLVEFPNLASGLIRQAAAHHRSIMSGDVLEANVYLEPFLDEIRAQIPEAEFIHLHRNGRDVVRSILNRDWYDTPLDRRHRTVPIPNWDELNQFERACWYYRYTQERLMTATETRIDFERMVSDLAYLTRTLRELGIVVHPLLAETEFPKRIDANRRDEFPAYEHWSREYKRTFNSICADVQSVLGYPKDELPDGLSPALIAENNRRLAVTIRKDPSHYDEYGPSWYDRHWSSTGPTLCASHLWAARLLRDPILDVGCGPGLLMDRLKDSGVVIGVDFSAVAVAQCRDKGHEAVQAPVESLPFPDAAFHTVVAIEVLEHVDDLDAALSEIHRVAREQIIITVPPNMASSSHKQVWPLEQWQEVLELGAPDFYDGVHVGWVLPPDPRRVRTRGPGALLEIDLTRQKLRGVFATHVNFRRDKAGLHIQTDASGISSAHLLLAKGTWHVVAPKHAFPTDHDSYYICRVMAEMPVGMAVRLFVIWYDDKGRRLHHDHIGTLRSGTLTTTCSFSAAPDSSHFAIALHLGDQPPQHVMTLRSVTVKAISLDSDYRLRLPGARAVPHGQAPTRSAADERGVEV